MPTTAATRRRAHAGSSARCVRTSRSIPGSIPFPCAGSEAPVQAASAARSRFGLRKVNATRESWDSCGLPACSTPVSLGKRSPIDLSKCTSTLQPLFLYGVGDRPDRRGEDMEQIRLPTRHEPAVRTAAPVRGAQVHVVDDDAGVRAALARLLRSRDYEVIVHENAEA